jgi:hypothetical protein
MRGRNFRLSWKAQRYLDGKVTCYGSSFQGMKIFWNFFS